MKNILKKLAIILLTLVIVAISIFVAVAYSAVSFSLLQSGTISLMSGGILVTIALIVMGISLCGVNSFKNARIKEKNLSIPAAMFSISGISLICFLAIPMFAQFLVFIGNLIVVTFKMLL